jgi:hypothetical protein
VCMYVYIINIYIHIGDAAEVLGDDAPGRTRPLVPCRYAIYLLYWYKSTNTDAEGASASEYQHSWKSQDANGNELTMQIPLEEPGVECGKWVAAGTLCPLCKLSPLLHSHMHILKRMHLERC